MSKYVFFSDDEDEKPAKKELKPGAAKGFLKKEAGGDDDDEDSDSEDWGSSDSVRFPPYMNTDGGRGAPLRVPKRPTPSLKRPKS